MFENSRTKCKYEWADKHNIVCCLMTKREARQTFKKANLKYIIALNYCLHTEREREYWHYFQHRDDVMRSMRQRDRKKAMMMMMPSRRQVLYNIIIICETIKHILIRIFYFFMLLINVCSLILTRVQRMAQKKCAYNSKLWYEMSLSIKCAARNVFVCEHWTISLDLYRWWNYLKQIFCDRPGDIRNIFEKWINCFQTVLFFKEIISSHV